MLTFRYKLVVSIIDGVLRNIVPHKQPRRTYVTISNDTESLGRYCYCSQHYNHSAKWFRTVELWRVLIT